MIDIDVSKIISEIGEPKARLIENEAEKQQKKYIQVFSFAFLVIFILGLGVFFFLSKNEKARALSLTKEVNDLKQANSQLSATENQALFIQQRNQNLLKIIRNNPNWSYVFETLEEVVPKGITFSRFEVESPAVMRIAGISPDYATLSKLAVSMSDFVIKENDLENKAFGSVNVTNASLVKAQEKTIVEFTIAFSFVKKINKEAVNPVVEAPKEIPAPIPIPTPTPVIPVPEPTPTPSENSGLPTL